MKSIIMTAQDAREFEKLGGLTITKPIKPAPVAYVEGAKMEEVSPGAWNLIREGVVYAHDGGAVFTPPVNAGDIVFLREPWHRLKNPSDGEPSDRVILAADSTVSEGQTSYKWSSPVSMPEEAARRIAEQIEDAQNRVNRLFGEGAEDLGFKPIAGDGAIELLERVVELIARGPISSAPLNIRGQCKAKFSITSKGKIKVSRSETRSCDLEAGE